MFSPPKPPPLFESMPELAALRAEQHDEPRRECAALPGIIDAGTEGGARDSPATRGIADGSADVRGS